MDSPVRNKSNSEKFCKLFSKTEISKLDENFDGVSKRNSCHLTRLNLEKSLSPVENYMETKETSDKEKIDDKQTYFEDCNEFKSEGSFIFKV